MEERIKELEKRVDDLERMQIETIKTLGLVTERIGDLHEVDRQILETIKLITTK